MLAILASSQVSAFTLEAALDDAQSEALRLAQQRVDADRQLADVQGRLDAMARQQAEASRQLERDQAALYALVRRLYKGRAGFLESILAAGGFGQLLEAIGYDSVLVDRQMALLRKVRAGKLVLERAKARLESDRAERERARRTLVVTQAAIDEEVAIEGALLARLQSAVDATLASLGSADSDSSRQRALLLQLHAEVLALQARQLAWTGGVPVTTVSLANTGALLATPGHFAWPVAGAVVSQAFGPTPYAFEPAFAGFSHFHTGVDLAIRMGTPVLAAEDGVVISARPMTDGAGDLVGYGNYLILGHNAGVKTLYGHLLGFVVKPGDIVRRGQLIGLVGSTGNSTGPHTHFEVRVNDIPVDPMRLLG